jgi:hypothetical protein
MNKNYFIFGGIIVLAGVGAYFVFRKKVSKIDATLPTTNSQTDGKEDALIIAQRIAELRKLIVTPPYSYVNCNKTLSPSSADFDKCNVRKKVEETNTKYKTELDLLNVVLTKNGFKEINGQVIKA